MNRLVRPTTQSYVQPSPLVVIATPSDTIDLDYYSREIWIRGTDGTLTVRFEEGNTEETFDVVVGDKLPWSVSRILATGTTATGIWVHH